MNVNNFFRTLFEDTLGLDVLGLDNRFADFVKLIDRNTLVTFSNLIPAKYLTYLDLSDPRNIVRKDRHTRSLRSQLQRLLFQFDRIPAEPDIGRCVHGKRVHTEPDVDRQCHSVQDVQRASRSSDIIPSELCL